MAPDVEWINGVTDKIIGCSFRVLNTLGSGFLEKVYENALAYELRKQGLIVEQRHPLPVYYEGFSSGISWPT
jgi:GxxExxY protein